MGMVQWSPDTPGERAVKGGYWYPDHLITGFPLTHFSGRGVTYLQDIPVLPVTSIVRASPGTHWRMYAASFSHRHEHAHPGFYAVRLDNGIRVALTTTARTGYGRFYFPPGARRTVLIRTDSAVTVTGINEVTGWHRTTIGGGKKPYILYFVAEFQQPFTKIATWSGDTMTAGQHVARGPACGACLTFGGDSHTPVQMKVGVSFVSLEGARRNLESESPGWNFEAVRGAADRAWDIVLSRVRVNGGSLSERRIFYTALYHCFFHPNLLNDVDGRYPGMDGRVHSVSRGHAQYQNIPAWDQYRSFAALRAILTPHEAADIVQSLVNYAQQDAAVRPAGGGLPRWEQVNRNSGGMVGDGDDVIVATTFAFGASDFDKAGALAAMEKGASVPGTTSDGIPVRKGLADYLHLGYVPGSCSITQEYCVADYALAQFAGALGHPGSQVVYAKRAENWRKLYNPATGFLEPRNAGGKFPSRFDAAETKGYTEGSASQYLWLVNFDFHGLISLLGGNAAAIRRLDALFTQLDAPPHSVHVYMGNEPNEATPWAYDFADAPASTQAVVRRIELGTFHDSPGGLPGNDDAGALSSWFVFSALGLYPVKPGVAGFAIGSPLFPVAVIAVPNRSAIRIEAEGAAPNAPYVQALSLDGKPWPDTWLPWTKICGGAVLHFTLGIRPSAWGAADSPRRAP